MSHYAVAVFADDGDYHSLLAPYNKFDKNYFVFQPVEFETIKARFKKFQEQNIMWTFEEYLEAFKYIQKDGQWGYMHNPNGRWDWYTLGGKSYMFELKDGVELAEDDWDFRKNDYDWYPNTDDEETDAAEFWDEQIENEIGDASSIYRREYYLKRYMTKKQYVKEMSRVIPYAFITPDGVWHSAGRVGCFAESDETAEDADRYAKEWDRWIASDANPYVSLVDCHV